MLNLRSITYKNFMGVGNSPITVDLTKHNTTLITGLNGAGKSSLLEAIVFALYNRSYRGVNKDELINKTNQKACVVELLFSIGSKQYKIVRGMKPNIFQIYENDVLFDKDAAIKDHQSFLEEIIIKRTFKTFCQVDILGSANYVPFMQLKSQDRRDIVENLLEISVFSEMNKNLKVKMSEWDVLKSENFRSIELTEINIENQRKFIDRIDTDTTKRISQLANDISTIKANILQNDEIIKSLRGYKTSYEQLELAKYQKSDTLKKYQFTITQLERKLSQFKDVAHDCSECDRPHDPTKIAHLQAIVDNDRKKCVDEISEYNSSIKSLEDDITTLSDGMLGLKPDIEKLNMLEAERKFNINNGIKLSNDLKVLKSEVNNDIAAEREVLSDLANELKTLKIEESNLLTAKSVLDSAAKLLKDTGIKTVIIKKYIPLFNQFVNKYLTILNFNVKFSLDENFNDTITVFSGQQFPYKLFSMGQQMRIDLAVLFAWRELAKTKNSMSCNFLALDEIFDSSLDAQGAEDLMTILTSLGQDARIVVVSHRSDNLVDILDRHLVFTMKNGFTSVEEQ